MSANRPLLASFDGSNGSDEGSSQSSPEIKANAGSLLVSAVASTLTTASSSAVFLKEFSDALRLKRARSTDGGEEDGEEAYDDGGDPDALWTVGVEGKAFRARWSFHGTDSDEVDIPKGAVLAGIARNADWYLVRVEDDDSVGLVPVAYVVEVDPAVRQA